MFKLKQENKQLKEENADLRHELEDAKELIEQREKFALQESHENRTRKMQLEKIERIVYRNNYNNTELQLRLIKEVISPSNQITSK